MKRGPHFLPVVAVVGYLAITNVNPAMAQTTAPQGAFSGLFAGDNSKAKARQTLDFGVSLSEAFDGDVPAELPGTFTPTSPQGGGHSTMLVGTADYALKRRRAQVAASASSGLAQYRGADQVNTVTQSADLGLTTRLSRRTTLLVGQTAAYSPQYLYELFQTFTGSGAAVAAPTAPAAAEYHLNESEAFSYGTRMTLTHGSDFGSKVTATAEFVRTDFQQENAARPDLAVYGAQGQFRHSLSRNTGFAVGYHYRTGEFGDGAARSAGTTDHGIDLGVDYSRPLSVTRRAVFRFNIATSSVDIPVTAPSVAAERLYRLVGDVTLDYPFRRTWHARANYGRGLEYLAALGEPVFVDGATLAVEGPVTRRTNVSASVRYSNGESALARDSLTFTTYMSELRVRHALKPAVTVYAEYLFHFYDFRQDAPLAPGLPRHLAVNGVRVGLAVLVPALRR